MRRRRACVVSAALILAAIAAGFVLGATLADLMEGYLS